MYIYTNAQIHKLAQAYMYINIHKHTQTYIPTLPQDGI